MYTIVLISIFETLLVPHESWTTRVIDELRLRGVRVVKFVNAQPYKLSEVLDSEKRHEISSEDQILLKRLGFLDVSTPQVRLYPAGRALADTAARYFQYLGLVASLPGFGISITPFVKFGNSEDYPSRLWKDAVGGDFQRACGSLRLGPIDILVGRESLRWGPLPGNSLLISGTSPPFDVLSASCEYKFFKGSFFCTALDPSTLADDYVSFPQSDTFPAGTYNRFLSGHRVEFSFFGDDFLIGLSEIILYSGKGVSFMPTYLNPFVLYYVSKHNWKNSVHTDNIGWGFDFSYYIRNTLCFYGELFIDDAQYESSPENVPNMLAYRIGLKGVCARSFWAMQYMRVDTWTYIHPFYWNDFLYRDYPIGHPEGQDFDKVFAEYTNHVNYRWDILFDISFRRKGANNFSNRWPGVFVAEQKFPSGNVEKSISINAGFRFFHADRIFVEALAGYNFYYDFHNDEDQNKSFASLQLNYSCVIF
jgi:hypothetical protein